MSIKEKLVAWKNSAVQFCKDHKTGIGVAAVGIGTFVLGSYATYKHLNRSVDSEAEVDERSDATYIDVDPHDPYEWNEEAYRETWDRVNEFAETLHLHEGESYIIDDSSQYEDLDWYKGRTDGLPIVSHMVNGIGIYPPEKES